MKLKLTKNNLKVAVGKWVMFTVVTQGSEVFPYSDPRYEKIVTSLSERIKNAFDIKDSNNKLIDIAAAAAKELDCIDIFVTTKDPIDYLCKIRTQICYVILNKIKSGEID